MSKSPNLLFVFPDEFRPFSIGALGREKVITPNLDRFAASGTVFTNVASNYPVCSPYRGILLTGKYPYKNGVVGNCRSTQAAVSLAEDSYCLSDHLAASGYSTGYIGKWHLQAPRPGDEIHGEGPRSDGVIWDTYTPPGKGRHGFDFWHSYGCCDNHNAPHYWTGNAGIDEAIYPGTWSAEHESDVAIDFIRNSDRQRDSDRPFALFVAYNPPHMPFDQVPKRYKELYEGAGPDDLLTWENLTEEGRRKAAPHIKNYFSMISGIDDQFGRILKALDESGQAENTLVIFTSDHGELMGSHGLMHKNHWQNESFLVPFIARLPGRIRPGAVDTAVFSTIDLFPTLLGLLGLGDGTPVDLDGTDVSQRLTDGESPDAGVALYMDIDHSDCTGGRRGIKTDRYTLVLSKDRSGIEYSLIDDTADPYQLQNIYGRRPEVEADLKRRLEHLLVEAGDPFQCMEL